MELSFRLIGDPSSKGLWFSYRLQDVDSHGFLYYSVTTGSSFQTARDIREGEHSQCHGLRRLQDSDLHPVFLKCSLVENKNYRLWAAVDENGHGYREKVLTPDGIPVTLGAIKAPPDVDVQIISPVTPMSVKIRYSILNPIRGGYMYWALANPGIQLTASNLHNGENTLCSGYSMQSDSNWHMLPIACALESGKHYVLWMLIDLDRSGRHSKMVFTQGMTLYIVQKKNNNCVCGTDCTLNGRLGICSMDGVCEFGQIANCAALKGDDGTYHQKNVDLSQTECREAYLCSVHLCQVHPEAIDYCSCSCGKKPTNFPTQAPSVHKETCAESHECSSEICSLHPDSSQWFCPCSCSAVFNPDASFFEYPMQSFGVYSQEPPWNSKGGMLDQNGLLAPRSMQNVQSSYDPPLFACNGLPWADCYGITIDGTECMWNARKGYCTEANAFKAEDFCNTFAIPRQCDSQFGVCCWDVDGYCGKYDAGDCALPGFSKAGILVSRTAPTIVRNSFTFDSDDENRNSTLIFALGSEDDSNVFFMLLTGLIAIILLFFASYTVIQRVFFSHERKMSDVLFHQTLV